MALPGDCTDSSRSALGLLTAGLDRQDGVHEQLFRELVATHEGAAALAMGLANVAELLFLDLAEVSGRSPEDVLQRLGLELHAIAVEEQHERDDS